MQIITASQKGMKYKEVQGFLRIIINSTGTTLLAMPHGKPSNTTLCCQGACLASLNGCESILRGSKAKKTIDTLSHPTIQGSDHRPGAFQVAPKPEGAT